MEEIMICLICGEQFILFDKSLSNPAIECIYCGGIL